MKHILIGILIYTLWVFHFWLWIGILYDYWYPLHYTQDIKTDFIFMGIGIGFIVGLGVGGILYVIQLDKKV